MTETFSFYILDEDVLPNGLDSLSDQEKYDSLVSSVESSGILHTSVEMVLDDFVDALETLDDQIDERFLTVCAMNNSPFDILGKNGDCPYFGYFSPAEVQRVFNAIENLPDDAVDTIESFETHSEVFQALKTAITEAFKTGYAIAIVHA